MFSLCAALGQDIWITPNQGQWIDTIDFSIPVASGRIHGGKDGLNYVMYELPHGHDRVEEKSFRIHSIDQHFLNHSSVKPEFKGKTSSHYSNFFLGSDKSSWRANVYDYQGVKYPSFYPNIDLIYSTQSEQLSYAFKVYPHGKIEDIAFEIIGATRCDI
ncbi:MAG: hypothetical protein EBV19_10570, partial [Flavobacteriia bacterium]|nr:hypothetical protein [Flavobacteriia bacterium]